MTITSLGLKTTANAAIRGDKKKVVDDDGRRHIRTASLRAPNNLLVAYMAISIRLQCQNMMLGKSGRKIDKLAIVDQRGDELFGRPVEIPMSVP